MASVDGRRSGGRPASGKTSKSGSGKSRSSGSGRRAAPRPSEKRKSTNAKLAKKRRTKKREKRVLLAVILILIILAVIAAGIVIVRIGRVVSDAVGPEDYQTSTAEFRKDGSIRVTSVEALDQEYYDSDELSKDIQDSVKSYNVKKGSTGVTEESFSVTGESAKVVLIYESADDYEDFNDTTLFMGTVQEAESAGFDFESIMQAVSNEDSSRILTKATLDQLLSNQVIILTEKMDVVLPKKEKFLYATANLGVTDFQHATAIDTISDEKPAIIILQ